MLCNVVLISEQYRELQNSLLQFFGIKNVFLATDAIMAEKLIEQTMPEIVVSEIELIDQSEALSCLQKCQQRELILVSADDSYAIKAFEFNASDFVLAPFDCNRLMLAVEKTVQAVRRRKARTLDMVARLVGQYGDGRPSVLDKKLMIRETSRVRFVNQKDILYIKGAGGNYIELHFADGNKILHRETLANLQHDLDSKIFKRIHRSIIVNTNYVQELTTQRTGGVVVKLKGGDELTLGRHKKALMDSILAEF